MGAEGVGTLGKELIVSGMSDVSWMVRMPGIASMGQWAHPLLARVFVIALNLVNMTSLCL